ncbi:hypothetical protein D3C71_1422820 [compost metagenome]
MVYNEIELFLNHVKPAVMFKKEIYDKNHININKYHHAEFRGNILISHSPLPEINDNDKILIGKILGYYPESCDIVLPNYDVNEFINYGGIHFSTRMLYDDALEWCHNEYKDKLLNKFKKFKYFRICYSKDTGARIDLNSVTMVRK